MGDGLSEGCDFRCRHRTGRVSLQLINGAKKFKIFRVVFRKTEIKAEIRKKVGKGSRIDPGFTVVF